MSQLFYPAAEGFLTGTLNWATMNVAAVLVDASYVFSAADEFLDAIPLSARRSGFKWLSSLTTTNGFAGGSYLVFDDVDASSPVTQLILFDDTGTEGTSRLIAYYDDAPGFPLTTDDDYLVAPSLDHNGYFQL